MLKLNPWFTIWFSPKETLRAIVDFDPKYRFLLMSFIYGFVWMLSMSQTLSLGHYYGPIVLSIASIVLAIPIGYCLMSISTLFFHLVGKVFKGRASFMEVRAAVAFANIPSIVTILTWIILMFAYGDRIFMADKGKIGASFGLVDGMFIVQVIIAVWSLAILLFGLAEVQKFSIYRAVGSFLLVTCLWVIITLIFMFFIAYYSKPAALAFLELL
jgi:hypothetical protein